MRMKIAMIGQKGIPTQFGGVERHVESLAMRLGALGHNVIVYNRAWYSQAEGAFAPGVTIVTTPSINSKHLDAITHTLTSTIHAIRSGADVIHYHGVGPSLLAWIPRLFAPEVRVVSTFHSVDRKHQKWGVIARFALWLGELAAAAFPHETIVISKGLHSYVFDRYNCNARYIPNGVDVPAENIAHDRIDKFGLTPSKYLVINGRLIRLKGVHYAIEAYRSLKRNARHDGMKLVIIGDSTNSDDYVSELRAMAGGDLDIVFTGFRQGEDLAQLMANAYAAVHPSETEGLSLAVLEEMANGLTVLASDIPGNIEALGGHDVPFNECR